MNLHDWKSKKQHIDRLAELLRDPVMIAAFSVVREHHEPGVPDREGLALQGDINGELARRYAHRAGVYGALKFLEALAAPSQIVAPALQPWGELVDTNAEPKKK